MEGYPLYFFEGLAVLFGIGAVGIFALKDFKGGWRYMAELLLAEYVFVLYCSTVIFRHVSSVREYDFTPFWSYRAYFSGPFYLLFSEKNCIFAAVIGYQQYVQAFL